MLSAAWFENIAGLFCQNVIKKLAPISRNNQADNVVGEEREGTFIYSAGRHAGQILENVSVRARKGKI